MILYLNNYCKDDKYFNYLYNTYYNYAYKICYNVLGNVSFLEDVLQDAFVKIYKTIGTLKRRKAEKAWIGVIVRNTAKDTLRSRKNQETLEVDIEQELIDIIIESDEPTPFERILVSEAVEHILDKIKNMDKKYSDIILMKCYYGFEIREISALFNIPLKTVYTRYGRGIKALKALFVSEQYFDEYYPEEVKNNETKKF